MPETRTAAPTNADAELLTSYRAGDQVYAEGDPGGLLYIIERGEIEIVRRAGEREVRLALLGPGEFFGEMAVLENLPRSATARCVSDCRLLEIDAPTFDRVLVEHPDLASLFMRKLAGRLREMVRADLRARQVAAGVLAGIERRDEVSRALPMARLRDPSARPRESEGPCLVHRGSGRSFALAEGSKTFVGRLDPRTGQRPDLDLGAIDDGPTLSRRHAVIERRRGRYFVREPEPSANGTWVGGHRLAAGEERELRGGDILKLGLVELTFHSGAEG